MDFPEGISSDHRKLWIDFVNRWQQFTGPVMAKGVEDTSFYLYSPLISANEVGGDPEHLSTSSDRFHTLNRNRLEHEPRALSATSTHDTKRSEDVRARLHLLAEVPSLWADSVRRWAAHNDHHRRRGMPSRNDEYHLYQTLVGAWPIARERLHPALVKSAREAKTHTSWQRPDPAYEGALVGFADACLDDRVFAAELAARLGRIDAARVAFHRDVVESFGLSTALPPGLDPGRLVTFMARDKKAAHDLTFVLDGPHGVEMVRGIGPEDVVATLGSMDRAR